MADSPPDNSQPRAPDWGAVFIAGIIALVTVLLLLTIFTPRFVMWRGLFLPGCRWSPEFARAMVTLAQVRDPWMTIDDPGYVALSWRLLFPFAWHYLHLPRATYLAMPFVGCLLTLWLVAWLTHKRIGRWPATLLATLLFGALPWFFASTGWLTYFDSWLVLGLLTASFVNDRRSLVAACLLTPWIDERFVLALPLCLLVRGLALGNVETRNFRPLGVDALLIGVTTTPYLLLRAIAWLTSDPASAAYVALHWKHAWEISWYWLSRGLWSGFRAGWIIVLATVVLSVRRAGWQWGVLLAVAVSCFALGGLYIAADMSRTMTMLCPVFLLGIWLCAEMPSRFAWLALAIVLVANLLLPAAHAMWGSQVTIHSLPAEVARWHNPPAFIAAADLSQQAQQLMEQRSFGRARKKLDAAIELEPDYPAPYVRRALLKIQDRDFAAAVPDIEQAKRLLPDDPTPFYVEGVMYQAEGKLELAKDHFKQALDIAPRDWAQRAEVERTIEQLAGGVR